MKKIGPKTRLARRIGEALRDKDTKYLVKRNYPPGMHGQARSRRSEYALELAEKQKAKWRYDVNERQFRRYVKKSMQKRELTPDVLLELLESRLDNIVYRLGFATSRAQARQLVSHGFVMVNEKRVNIPSYQVRVGDEIAINPGKRTTKFIQYLEPLLKDYKPQEWLSLDHKNLRGKVLSRPTAQNTGSTIQMELVIEHFSR